MNKRIAFEDQLVLGVLATCLIVAVIGSNQARFEQICSNGISNHQGQPTSQGDQNPNVLNPRLIHGAFLVGLAQREKSQNNPCQNAWSIIWPWGWPSSDVWQAIFDFLLVIVGWRTLTVYDRQRRIMGEQNSLMKRQSEVMMGQLLLTKEVAAQQLRAYVCVTGARVEFDAPGSRPHALVEFKNSGQTPAYNTRIWVSIWMESHPLRVDLPRQKDDFFGGTSIIAPGGATTLKSAEVRAQTREVWSKFGTAECTIYAYGRASYVDAFGERRHTDFRMIYGGPDGGDPKGMMQFDSEGNNAT